jgi:MFS transporter, PHS family, inorganic phosphate transporter
VDIPLKKKLTFYDFISVRRNLFILIGTSVSWFALDVGFYGVNLNNPIILDAIGYNNNSTPYNTLLSSA